MLEETLLSAREVRIRQRKEVAELFGLETRNKYEIRNEQDQVIGFAAEQSKGFLAGLGRYFLGHWRRFEIFIFNNSRQQILRLEHPFRWFFQRVEVYTATGSKLGALQQRFSILRKRFDVEDASGSVIFEMDSPIWKPWTFPIHKKGVEVALIKKRWSGLLKETFLDADNFTITLQPGRLSTNERWLVLSAGLFVDLQYFEKKAKRN